MLSELSFKPSQDAMAFPGYASLRDRLLEVYAFAQDNIHTGLGFHPDQTAKLAVTGMSRLTAKPIECSVLYMTLIGEYQCSISVRVDILERGKRRKPLRCLWVKIDFTNAGWENHGGLYSFFEIVYVNDKLIMRNYRY